MLRLLASRLLFASLSCDSLDFGPEAHVQVALEQIRILGSRQRRREPNSGFDRAPDRVIAIACSDVSLDHVPSRQLYYADHAIEPGVGRKRPRPVALDLV